MSRISYDQIRILNTLISLHGILTLKKLKVRQKGEGKESSAGEALFEEIERINRVLKCEKK